MKKYLYILAAMIFPVCLIAAEISFTRVNIITNNVTASGTVDARIIIGDTINTDRFYLAEGTTMFYLSNIFSGGHYFPRFIMSDTNKTYNIFSVSSDHITLDGTVGGDTATFTKTLEAGYYTSTGHTGYPVLNLPGDTQVYQTSGSTVKFASSKSIALAEKQILVVDFIGEKTGVSNVYNINILGGSTVSPGQYATLSTGSTAEATYTCHVEITGLGSNTNVSATLIDSVTGHTFYLNAVIGYDMRPGQNISILINGFGTDVVEESRASWTVRP